MVGRLDVKGMYYSCKAIHTIKVLVCRVLDPLARSAVKHAFMMKSPGGLTIVFC